MIINFVGNFASTGSGEIADESHIARSMEELENTVRKIPRDEWREFVISGNEYPNIPKDLKADINIIAKWDKFHDGNFIKVLKKLSKAPVFYWVWDSVDLTIDWHREMAKEADLYLSGELGRAMEFTLHKIKFYYFQFDCVDENIKIFDNEEEKYDVVYLGTYDNQNGRMDLLKEINKEVPIIAFGQNYQAFMDNGIDAYSAVYGEEANKIIGQSKIVLGTSCDPHLYGYWSNRVGRVLKAGGSLLQQYTPGMENFLHDYVEYWSTPKEAIEKIKNCLYGNYNYRVIDDTYNFTSKQKIIDLLIMIERYLKEDNGKDWLLP
ncbi:MAG: glycosyltransferase family protein [Rhabdochlamydiaceae bacterium]